MHLLLWVIYCWWTADFRYTKDSVVLCRSCHTPNNLRSILTCGAVFRCSISPHLWRFCLPFEGWYYKLPRWKAHNKEHKMKQEDNARFYKNVTFPLKVMSNRIGMVVKFGLQVRIWKIRWENYKSYRCIKVYSILRSERTWLESHTLEYKPLLSCAWF
jgi:hypothetical protein